VTNSGIKDGKEKENYLKANQIFISSLKYLNNSSIS